MLSEKIAVLRPFLLLGVFLISSSGLFYLGQKSLFQKDQKAEQACQPFMTGTEGVVTLFQLKCSEDDLEEQGEGFELTPTFKIPDGMFARRFHFWRKVFTTWSKDERVINSEEYPEVVLEFGSLSATGGKRSATPKEISLLTRTMNKRIRHYAKILHGMHKKSPDKFSGEENRIKKLTDHIKDPQKYLKISKSLRLQQGQREHMITGLETAQKYLVHIKKQFEQEGVPVELAYIAFIESSFNLKAKSHVGASGVYQIMPRTGKQFLRIDRTIDERSDPVKAGRVAAKLFKENYQILGNWPLAITAYNHGPYGMLKKVKRFGTSDLETLINIHTSRTFRYASKNFYVEFLAMIDIIEHKEDLFPEVKEIEPIVYKDLKMPHAKRVKSFLAEHKMSSESLLELNPDINPSLVWRNGYLPKNHIVKISDADQVAQTD